MGDTKNNAAIYATQDENQKWIVVRQEEGFPPTKIGEQTYSKKSQAEKMAEKIRSGEAKSLESGGSAPMYSDEFLQDYTDILKEEGVGEDKEKELDLALLKFQDAKISEDLARKFFIGKKVETEGEYQGRRAPNIYRYTIDYIPRLIKAFFEDYDKNHFDAGFKYLEISDESLQSIGFRKIGDLTEEYVNPITEKPSSKDYQAWISEDGSTVLSHSNYSGLFSTDMNKGYEYTMAIIEKAEYIKDIDVFNNGLGGFSTEFSLKVIEEHGSGEKKAEEVKVEGGSQEEPAKDSDVADFFKSIDTSKLPKAAKEKVEDIMAHSLFSENTIASTHPDYVAVKTIIEEKFPDALPKEAEEEVSQDEIKQVMKGIEAAMKYATDDKKKKELEQVIRGLSFLVKE